MQPFIKQALLNKAMEMMDENMSEHTASFLLDTSNISLDLDEASKLLDICDYLEQNAKLS